MTVYSQSELGVFKYCLLGLKTHAFLAYSFHFPSVTFCKWIAESFPNDDESLYSYGKLLQY